MVEGMSYILRTGCPWRDLPDWFGPWTSVYIRFWRWSRQGVWAAMLRLLTAGQQGELHHLDASHIKVHQDGSTGGHHPTEAIGKTKGGLNTKLTALVNSQGKALQIALAPGQRADLKAVEAIKLPAHGRVVADKSYDSYAFRDKIFASGAKPCIPPKKNRVRRISWHRGWYAKRHKIENFFQRIKRLRRTGTRYDKSACSFLAFLHFAAILDWLK